MRHHLPKKFVYIGIITISIGAIGYGVFAYWKLHQNYRAARATIAELRKTISELKDSLSLTEYERDRLNNTLAQTQDRAQNLEATSAELAGAVDTLTKLTELDPELLKKYSKVYFLNEHYTPSELVDIEPEYLSNSARTLQIHAQVSGYLKKMLDDATEAGLKLRIASAYRSFKTQESLKTSYKVTYGTTSANKFSADQGYSEHQLGTTVDLTTASSGALSSSFEKTTEFKWLTQHAYKYGFVLSYPKNNKYYIYEPWHWRFVGVKLATMLHEEGLYLYDVDQREIDTYLISIFD